MMIQHFGSPLASDLRGFLEFKRSLGYRYERAEFTLREFDQFLQTYMETRPDWQLDRAMLDWLGAKPGRQPISVCADMAVLRQFCAYLRRHPGHPRACEPRWPRLPGASKFVPYVLSKAEVRILLELAAGLKRPQFRAVLYRALLLLLYCTGLRFGEALRLRIRDVDTTSAVIFVELFKGRARWVPFHRSLARELDTYLVARRAFAPAEPHDYFFVNANKRRLSAGPASETVRKLLRQAGLKPSQGRAGPRAYDFRHSFAVHRLALWYRQGVDLQSRLPWLSAYLGHDDILGTETYLTATPQLLGLAADRFRRRYLRSSPEGGAKP